MREQTGCLTRLEYCKLVRQPGQLIIVHRGAPPKARLSFLAQSADCFALGHRADEAYIRAHLAPKKRYQRFSLRAARPAPKRKTHPKWCVFFFTTSSSWSVRDRISRLYHFAIARSRVTLKHHCLSGKIPIKNLIYTRSPPPHFYIKCETLL